MVMMCRKCEVIVIFIDYDPLVYQILRTSSFLPEAYSDERDNKVAFI